MSTLSSNEPNDRQQPAQPLDLPPVEPTPAPASPPTASPSPTTPQATPPLGGTSMFRATPSGFVKLKNGQEDQAIRLTNFTGKIVTERVHDDGGEQSRQFEMDVQMGGKVQRLMLAASEFESMRWVIKRLGSRAMIYPGYGTEGDVVHAIQMNSDAEEVIEYGHTGWREIDGQWVFLHADGGIDASGARSDVLMALTGTMASYRLPQPPSGQSLVKCWRSVLGLLDLAPDRITFPLLASIPRAILGDADCSLFLVGTTGTFKSETASLLQRFFGTPFTARNLPGSWSSTDNALEELAFLAKDVVLVVDDFKPSGNRSDDRLHQRADRVFRAQGNSSARQRMNADYSLRAPRPPRGLIVATGEDLPRGASLRARLFVIEIEPKMISSERLSACQTDAASGTYVQLTSAFCSWLAADLQSRREGFSRRREELRNEMATGGHARLDSALGDLLAAFELLVRFVREAAGDEGLTEEGAAGLMGRCREAMLAAASIQRDLQRETDPVDAYLSMLASGFSTGRFHADERNGGTPTEPDRWGWRHNASGILIPGGPLIAWVKGNDLYLDPQAAYKAVQDNAPDGERLAVTERTLRKRLFERKLLASTSSSRKTLTCRLQVKNLRREVLHLRVESVFPPEEKEATTEGPL